MTEEVKTNKPRYDLNVHTNRLLREEPFFCAISMRVSKIANSAIRTAGVRVNPHTGYFEMMYNPEFMDSLSDQDQKLVLMHEFYHLIFEHVTSRLPDDGMSMAWNHATDLAINGELFRENSDAVKGALYEMGLVPGKPDSPYADLEVGLSAEQYYPYCKKKLDEMRQQAQDGQSGGGQPGQGADGDGMPNPGDPNGGFDSHDDWNEDGENPIPNDLRELARERLADAMRAAAREATSKASWGSVSESMRKMIMDKITPKIDWRSALRYFIRTSQRADKSSTMKRINKRFPYIHPGRRTNRTARLAISIDQSGSVSDRMLAEFFAELNKLASLVEFTVIPFDTRVDPALVYTWKKGKRAHMERVMCGGTDFNAPTAYVNEHMFDGHIVLTDMCAPKPERSKCQRMWITDGQNAKNPYFTPEAYEKVIAID